MDNANPFDEFPYLAFPIPVTAPERLALASTLHGGPRVAPLRARVLELGCANGANLLPLAWYRREANFTGVDGSARQIGTADDCRKQLGLENVRFVNADFLAAGNRLEGLWDIIIVHGVFSWVPGEVRDRLLELCVQKLSPGGLLYLNYNARPGWNIRGSVRDFLLKHTAGAGGLESRAQLCREISARVIAPLAQVEHHYVQLMAHEFDLVRRQHPAYIAHEYLAPENVAYWRSEFMALTGRFGLEYIVDADFNSVINRSTRELRGLLAAENLSPGELDDSLDLLCYQQMHSPIMTHAGFRRSRPDDAEFGRLLMASSLAPAGADSDSPQDFRHPDGHEIEVHDDATREALLALRPLWPRGRPVAELFPDVAAGRENSEYLANAALVELRCIEPGDFGVDAEPLNRLERNMRAYVTTAYHDLSGVEESATGGP